MKKTIHLLLILTCLFVLFTGTALASSAPTAMSYFSNSIYNKTYTGEDGLQHTMKVLWVGETWNKVGTVIYFIDYADSYEKDGDRYTSEDAATMYFDNARPEYPDSSQYRVYSAKWYPDGHYTVLYDYRPSSTPEPTNTPIPTAKTSATPTAKPSAKPTSSKPSAKPATATPSITPEQTLLATPTATPVSSFTVTATSLPSPTTTVQNSPVAIMVSASPTQSPGTLPVQSNNDMRDELVAPIITLLGLCALGLTIFLIIKHRRRREDREGN